MYFGWPLTHYILKTKVLFKIFYLLCLVWAADTGAYFVGKYFGRHKLAPQISPNKTKEGVLGAFLSVIGFSWFGGYFISATWQMLLWLSLWVGLFAIVGDLFESALKRSVGLKDSGVLFPGHGGVLDRLDSLFAALPVFTFLVAY